MSGWQQPGAGPGNPYDPYAGQGFHGYEPGAPGPGEPGPGNGSDGISIAAFVCSVLCCTAPLGLGLGIAGLVRTKGGRRRGRWAAIWGTVLGAIGTLAIILGFGGLVWLGLNVAAEDEAEVGQCVDTSSFFGENDMWTAECDEAHDAEIVAAGRVDEDILRLRDSESVDGFCRSLAGREYASVLEDPAYELDWATDATSDDIDDGDHFACYVQRVDGTKLDAPLTGDGSVANTDA